MKTTKSEFTLYQVYRDGRLWIETRSRQEAVDSMFRKKVHDVQDGIESVWTWLAVKVRVVEHTKVIPWNGTMTDD